jgi:hypothetical protein
MANSASKGYTFGTTELVTNAKLHALVDSAVITVDTVDISSTPQNDFMIGDGGAGNKTLTVDNGDVALPQLRFNDSTNVWEVSNNGTEWAQMARVARGTFTHGNIVGGVVSLPQAVTLTAPFAVSLDLFAYSLASGASVPSIERVLPDKMYVSGTGISLSMGSMSAASNASVYFGYVYNA